MTGVPAHSSNKANDDDRLKSAALALARLLGEAFARELRLSGEIQEHHDEQKDCDEV
jgi:hypothetical protein